MRFLESESGLLSIGRLNEFVCLQEINKRAINGPKKSSERDLETWRKGLQSGYRPHESTCCGGTREFQLWIRIHSENVGGECWEMMFWEG